MSADNRSDDEPDFLDDEFVVEGLSEGEAQDDLDQLLALPPQAEAAPTPPATSADDAAAEELFAEPVADAPPSQTFGADQPLFAEDAPSHWNGAELELDDPSTTPASLTPPPADEPVAEFTLDSGEAWTDEATAGGADEAPTEAAEPADFLGLVPGASDDAALDEAPAEQDLFGDEPVADAETFEDVAEEVAPVLAGPAPAGARWGIMLASAAATLALVAGAAVVVMRPQWIGIADHAKAVATARVDRPHVEVELLPPAAVAVAAPSIPVVAGTPPAEPSAAPVVAQAPTPEEPKPVAPTPPAVVAEAAPVVAAVVPSPQATEPTAPVAVAPVAPAPVAPVAAPVEAAPVAAAPAVSWPVARGGDAGVAPRLRKPLGTLVRVGEDTMLGEADVATNDRHAVDGVIPGVKAFAQLRNGNFFIGSVKSIDRAQVTLRTSEGEVTLGKAELTRLTGLGSSDFEALQKATDGFVRLTNSNKLVGGILSQIADDHVVLEFRSNRVILPRSAVGEVVAGPQGDGVRLGVTSEEDDWVRKLAEREVGKPAEPKQPSKAGGK